jgi:hypothetical protein
METKQLKVVPLTEDDVKWFVEVAAVNMLIDEVKRPELVNLNQLYLLAFTGMQSDTAFVVKKGEECIGALGAIVIPNLFNPDLTTLVEVFWYVLPDYRNTRAGALLLKAFEERANEVADEATLSLLGSSTVNVATLEKRGFMLNEFCFRKQIKE